MPEIARAVGGAGLVVAAAAAAGAWFTRPLNLPASLRFGLGAAILSVLCFLLLLAGQGRWLVALCAGIAASGLPLIRRPAVHIDWRWLAFLPFLAYYAIHALAPEIQPDGITYHLGLASEWFRTGAVPARAGFYEMLPQAMESLFTVAYTVGAGPAAKLVHFAFLISAAGLIAWLARRLGARPCVAALLFFLTPVVGAAAASSYNDVALALAELMVFALLWSGEGDPRPAVDWWTGVAAGFCYAVKLPGIVIAPAAVLWLLVRRRPAAALRVAIGSALIAAPWMARTAWISGNPVAPLFNRWFPNAHFHQSTGEDLERTLRGYGVAPAELPVELTLRGRRTQGLLGPVFLLAPLGLWAARRREGRAVLAAAAIASIPWWLNTGTRFLIPAAAFVAIALALLPRPAAIALAIGHALLSLPPVIDLYADPWAWRLRSLPLKAALGLEPAPEYLRRELYEFQAAELLNRHVGAGEPVLDLAGAPRAYTHAIPFTYWQYAPANRAVGAIHLASQRETYVEYSAHWASAPVQAARVVSDGAIEQEWGVQELVLVRGGEAASPGPGWRVFAHPNPWEAPLALDRNLVSRWQTWRPTRRGDFLAVELAEPSILDGARFVMAAALRWAPVRLEIRTAASGPWRAVAATRKNLTELNRRREASRYLRREGFRYVLARPGPEGIGRLSQALLDAPGDWGMSLLGNAGGYHLLRVD